MVNELNPSIYAEYSIQLVTNIPEEVPAYSPSQIKTFRDCPLKWYYEKVLKKPKKPPTESAIKGTEGHARLELYAKCLNSGKSMLWFDQYKGDDPEKNRLKVLDRMVKPALNHIPKKTRLYPEINLLLKIDRFYFIMYVDLQYPGYIIDYKTTSDFKYALTKDGLKKDPQGVLYFLAGTEYQRSCKLKSPLVRRWIYLKSKGKPDIKLVELDTTEGIEEGLAGIMQNVRDMELLRDYPLEKIPKDCNSCGKYGGCDFKPICNKTKEDFDLENFDFVGSGVSNQKQLKDNGDSNMGVFEELASFVESKPEKEDVKAEAKTEVKEVITDKPLTESIDDNFGRKTKEMLADAESAKSPELSLNPPDEVVTQSDNDTSVQPPSPPQMESEQSPVTNEEREAWENSKQPDYDPSSKDTTEKASSKDTTEKKPTTGRRTAKIVQAELDEANKKIKELNSYINQLQHTMEGAPIEDTVSAGVYSGKTLLVGILPARGKEWTELLNEFNEWFNTVVVEFNESKGCHYRSIEYRKGVDELAEVFNHKLKEPTAPVVWFLDNTLDDKLIEVFSINADTILKGV